MGTYLLFGLLGVLVRGGRLFEGGQLPVIEKIW